MYPQHWCPLWVLELSWVWTQESSVPVICSDKTKYCGSCHGSWHQKSWASKCEEMQLCGNRDNGQHHCWEHQTEGYDRTFEGSPFGMRRNWDWTWTPDHSFVPPCTSLAGSLLTTETKFFIPNTQQPSPTNKTQPIQHPCSPRNFTQPPKVWPTFLGIISPWNAWHAWKITNSITYDSGKTKTLTRTLVF